MSEQSNTMTKPNGGEFNHEINSHVPNESQVNDSAAKLNALGLYCNYVKEEQHEALQHHCAALNILSSHMTRKDFKKSPSYSDMYWDTKNISIKAHSALTLSDIGNVHQRLANYDESAKAYRRALDIFRKDCNLSDNHPRIKAIERSVYHLDMYRRNEAKSSDNTGDSGPEIKSLSSPFTLSELTSLSTNLEDSDPIIKMSQVFPGDGCKTKIPVSSLSKKNKVVYGHQNESFDKPKPQILSKCVPQELLGLVVKNNKTREAIETRVSIENGSLASIASEISSTSLMSDHGIKNSYLNWDIGS